MNIALFSQSINGFPKCFIYDVLHSCLVEMTIQLNSSSLN